MCNSLHVDSGPIRKSGNGYKIFGKSLYWGEKRYGLSGLMGDGYDISEDGWVRWSNEYYGDGFCFFPIKREAERCLRRWVEAVPDDAEGTLFISRIAYREGVGRHKERNIVDGIPFDTALCREFKVEEAITPTTSRVGKR